MYPMKEYRGVASTGLEAKREVTGAPEGDQGGAAFRELQLMPLLQQALLEGAEAFFNTFSLCLVKGICQKLFRQ